MINHDGPIVRVIIPLSLCGMDPQVFQFFFETFGSFQFVDLITTRRILNSFSSSQQQCAVKYTLEKNDEKSLQKQKKKVRPHRQIDNAANFLQRHLKKSGRFDNKATEQNICRSKWIQILIFHI